MRTYSSAAATCAAALLLAACGGDDEPTEPAATAEDEGADAADAVEADDGDAAGMVAGGPDAAEGGEAEPDAHSELTTESVDAGGSGGSSTPQDVSLDLSQRHPNGAVVQVTELAFEGNSILVDAEFVNGATRDVLLRVEGGQRLRLSDDLGNAYNFVVPDEIDDAGIELPVGESIGGTFAFLGPVDPSAGDLTLAVNVYDPVDSFDPDRRWDGTNNPEFVLEGLDLQW